MRVSIKGVLIGGIVDVVSSNILALPFVIYAMAKVGLSHTPGPEMSKEVTNLIHASPTLRLGELLVGMACSILGGYVAAWLAKRDELLNGGLSSYLCLIVGIFSIATGKDSNPHWLQVLLLVASPLLGILGGALMRRLRERRLQPA